MLPKAGLNNYLREFTHSTYSEILLILLHPLFNFDISLTL